jgi:magnesium transporter
MIQSITLQDNHETEISLTELQSLSLSNVWLEVKDPTREELEKISEKSGIPLDFLRLPEASNVINLRLEPDFAVINFVIVRNVIEAKEIHPIVLAFSKDYLITVSKKEDQETLSLAKERMHRIRIDPPAIVAYYILDEIVSDHFLHLERIEALTANLEEEVLGKANQATIKKIFRLKSRLVSFNKILWYERGVVFNLKRCGAACLSAKAKDLFDTTHEYLTRQIDIVETYREIMSDAINAYLSTVSNKINSSIRNLTFVMFYLTIITTITSFPNTVATFFGISQFGNTHYLIIYAVLVLSIVLPFIWLWRRKWLKLEQ